MTDAATIERDTLYITDAELIRRMGVPEKVARAAIRELDRDYRRTGFPQRQALWADRRYWPAVKLWLDRHNGLNIPPQHTMASRGGIV